MKSKVQYYKVVNTKKGHYGFFYKVGLNVDPLKDKIPLEEVGSCQRGAFYFVTAKNIWNWRNSGDSIAWITPISPVKEDNNKFKAQIVRVTKILPFKKALPLIKEIPLGSWSLYGVTVSVDCILKSSMSLNEKFDWLDENSPQDRINFILFNKDRKSFIRHVICRRAIWELSDVKKLVENNLSELINEHELREVMWKHDYKLLRQIVESNPGKFYKMLCFFT